MRLLTNQRSPRWAFMESFLVPDYDTDGTYLMRLRIVQTPWFGVYLHRFDLPDPRPTLHDHPWNFRSLVLRGGYVEAVAYGTPRTQPAIGPAGWSTETLREHGEWVTHPAGSVNRKRAEDTHTIVHLLRVPTWTLMFVGRRRRDWGYVERDGTWTRFDQHWHAREFDAAMARRSEVA